MAWENMRQPFKKIFRIGKVVTAEICCQFDYSGIQIHLDKKEFNWLIGGLFGIEPTDKDYDNAHKWADNWIDQHNKKAHG